MREQKPAKPPTRKWRGLILGVWMTRAAHTKSEARSLFKRERPCKRLPKGLRVVEEK